MNPADPGSAEPTPAPPELPPAPPLGLLPWPPKRGRRVLYQLSPDHDAREATVQAHQEHALGSGPLRIVTLRPVLGEGRTGADFDAPWDRCSEPPPVKA